METFKQFVLTEVKDTKRNREDIIRSYGIADAGYTDTAAQRRASALIDVFTKVQPMIDNENDYFGVPGRKYDPNDIYSWAKVSKDLGYDKIEALQNLEAMITNLKKVGEQKKLDRISEKEYDIIHQGELATVYYPKSEAASCKLGRGTKWCTSSTKGGNQFDTYTQDQGVILIYVLANKEVESHRVEKYAFAMYPDGRYETFASDDSKMNEEEWKDMEAAFQIPPVEDMAKKLLPPALSVLRGMSNAHKELLLNHSGYSQDMSGPDEETAPWELLSEILTQVMLIVNDDDKTQLEAFQKYRKSEGMPDELFILYPFLSESVKYFNDRDINPVGSSPWGNKQYQEECVRFVRRLATVTEEVVSNVEDETYVHEMDDLTNAISWDGPYGSETASEIYNGIKQYKSRHMNDTWEEMEDACINLWTVNLASSILRRSKDPTIHTYGWLKIFVIQHDRWEKFENHMHKIIRSRGKEPKAIEGILKIGRQYNNTVNRMRGHGKWELFKAYLPETVGHMKIYFDGEWIEDELPLTKSAQAEVDFKTTKR